MSLPNSSTQALYSSTSKALANGWVSAMRQGIETEVRQWKELLLRFQTRLPEYRNKFQTALNSMTGFEIILKTPITNPDRWNQIETFLAKSIPATLNKIAIDYSLQFTTPSPINYENEPLLQLTLSIEKKFFNCLDEEHKTRRAHNKISQKKTMFKKQNIPLETLSSLPSSVSDIMPQFDRDAAASVANKIDETIDETSEMKVTRDVYALQTIFETLKSDNLLLTLCATHLKEPEPQDFLLTPWIQEYIKAQALTTETILYTQNRLTACIKFPEYHKHLIVDLSRANTVLTQNNEILTRLKPKIIERVALLYPQTESPDTLSTLEQQAEILVKSELQQQMEQFCQISFKYINNKKDRDICLALLTTIIKGFKSIFNLPLIDASNTINGLITRMNGHLALEENTFNFLKSHKLPTKEFTKEESIALITAIFPTKTSQKIKVKVLKQRIATLHHIAAQIKATPISKVVEFDHYQTEEALITSTYGQLDNELNLLISNLQSRIDLLPKEKPSYAVKESFAQLNQLKTVFQSTIISYQKEYQTIKEPLLTIDCPFERLRVLLPLQLTAMNELKVFKNELMQEELIARGYLIKLQEEYKTLTKNLARLLEEHIVDAKEASSLIPEMETTIQALTKSASNHLTILSNAVNQSILELSTQCDIEVLSLETQVINVKTQLEATFKLKEKDLGYIVEKYLYINKEPHPKNPLHAEFLAIRELEIAAYLRCISEGQTLQQKTGRQLKDWVTSINDNALNTEILNKRRQIMEADVVVLDERLNSKAYEASLHVIECLTDEFEKIINEYVDKAITNADTEETKALLQTIKNAPKHQLEQASKQTDIDRLLKPLNDIDARLIKIVRIMQEFQRINQCHINPDINLSTDKDYIESLIKNVTCHFHNNQMEDLSERPHYEFIQWLRVKVLKPLQKIQRDITNKFIVERYPDNHCYVTFFATRTEKEFISLGNNVLPRLYECA